MKILINSGLVSPVFKKRDKLIFEMQKKDNNVTISGYEKNVEDICKKYNCDYRYIPMNRAGINPLKDLKTLIQYYKLIKKEKYDCVHSYTAKPNIYGSIAAKLAGCKKIYPTVNGLGYAFTGNSLKNKLVRTVTCFLYKIAFSCSTKVFFQNKDDANELIKKKVVKKEKCVIISGSGIDLDVFKYKKVYNKNIFFLASRLLKTKGLNEYFEAAKIVKEKYPDAKFILAGPTDPNPDGITEDELKCHVDGGYIKYLGTLKDIKKEIEKCSVFVLPSYYREGVPHAVLEAMAVGRAILTCDSPGCRETINKKNGFLVEPKNADKLAKKMIWMIENPEQVEKMGDASRKYVEERFDVEIVNKEMLKTMDIL